MNDDDFINLLIRATEREELRRRLEEDEQYHTAEIQRSRFQIDRLRSRNRRLLESGVEELLGHVAQNETEIANLLACEADAFDVADRAQEMLPKVQLVQRGMLRILFPYAQHFADHSMIVGGPDVPGKVTTRLMYLKRCADIIEEAETELKDLRRIFISATERARRAGSDNTPTGGPEAEMNDSNSRKMRQQQAEALRAVQAKEKVVIRQRENQRARERTFFLETGYEWLVESGRMAPFEDMQECESSSSHSDLSYISEYYSVGTTAPQEDGDSSVSSDGANQAGRPALQTDRQSTASSQSSHTNFQNDGTDVEVNVRVVYKARAHAFRARQRLECVRNEYVTGYASYVFTFTVITHDTYDRLYADEEGRPYAEVEAEALEDLLQAEAGYTWAVAMAKAAGVPNMPLSPLSFATRTSDGHTNDAGTAWLADERRWAQKKKRRIERWARKVARGETSNSTRSSPVWQKSVGSRPSTPSARSSSLPPVRWLEKYHTLLGRPRPRAGRRRGP